MSTSVLPLSNIINVSLTGLPQGATVRNVNNVGFFTTETPSNVDIYRDYISAREVGVDYGTQSTAYAMANAIFAQSPNIRTGEGTLRIIPLIASVSATSGNETTADISANLVTLQTVVDGDLRITIDGGTPIDLTEIDLTSALTIENIGEILQTRLQDVIISTSASDEIEFLSKSVGLTGSSIVLAALPAGTGTDLAAAGYLNITASTTTAGVNATGETIIAAISRTQDIVSYVGIITDLEMEDAVIVTTATGIQALDMIFVHQFCSSQDIIGIITTLTAATDTHTRSLLYTVSRSTANLMKAAYVGRAFSVNFNGSLTSQTMMLKPLSTITPDTRMTQTIYNACAASTAGCDLYVSFDGVSSTVSNGGNLYFDQIYQRIALKFALEVGGFNYIRETNTKIPQTESGMTGLKGAYIVVLNQFVRNGYIGVGLTWTSSETFGNPVIFHTNIIESGYYIYSLPIAQQSQIERDAREAPLVQMAVKESGAIHSADLTVIINS